jgi:hypothetical protein
MFSTARKSLAGAGGLRALALGRSATAGAATKTTPASPASPSPTAAPQAREGGSQGTVKSQP